MVGTSHFVKSCPTCGRTLQIQIQYMGKRVTCGHCHGQFLAYYDDLDGNELTISDKDDVMRRVDELLSSLDGQVEQV